MTSLDDVQVLSAQQAASLSQIDEALVATELTIIFNGIKAQCNLGQKYLSYMTSTPPNPNWSSWDKDDGLMAKEQLYIKTQLTNSGYTLSLDPPVGQNSNMVGLRISWGN